jgi:hypothetical protein
VLGSGVSGPIRVLANNDVPKGAACLRIRCSLGGEFFSFLRPHLFSNRRAKSIGPTDQVSGLGLYQFPIVRSIFRSQLV